MDELKQQIIDIQAQHLRQWKKVLKPEAYVRLEKWAIETNEDTQKGMHHDQIRRGVALDSFIHNNLLLENNLYQES